MLHLEYFVIAFIVVAFIFFAVSIAILYPFLRRERQADVAEIRALQVKSTEAEHDA